VNLAGLIAVAIGGALGSWLRWLLGILFNPVFPTVPLGTVAANLLAALIMGCLLAVFEHFQSLPPAMRLFAITGFLGGLSTFSTFSAEASTLLLRQQYLWFGVQVSANLLGSLCMTILGIFITRNLLRA
jgi:CrcB protein